MNEFPHGRRDRFRTSRLKVLVGHMSGKLLREHLTAEGQTSTNRSPSLVRTLFGWFSAAPPKGGICVLSRQRLAGNTNGSSAYLLSLCEALRAGGHALHLVCPSPVMFGRWPGLIL